MGRLDPSGDGGRGRQGLARVAGPPVEPTGVGANPYASNGADTGGAFDTKALGSSLGRNFRCHPGSLAEAVRDPGTGQIRCGSPGSRTTLRAFRDDSTLAGARRAYRAPLDQGPPAPGSRPPRPPRSHRIPRRRRSTGRPRDLPRRPPPPRPATAAAPPSTFSGRSRSRIGQVCRGPALTMWVKRRKSSGLTCAAAIAGDVDAACAAPPPGIGGPAGRRHARTPSRPNRSRPSRPRRSTS